MGTSQSVRVTCSVPTIVTRIRNFVETHCVPSMRFLVLFLASAFCLYAALAQPSCPSTDDADRTQVRDLLTNCSPGFRPFRYNLEIRVPFEPYGIPKRRAQLSYV